MTRFAFLFALLLAGPALAQSSSITEFFAPTRTVSISAVGFSGLPATEVAWFIDNPARDKLGTITVDPQPQSITVQDGRVVALYSPPKILPSIVMSYQVRCQLREVSASPFPSTLQIQRAGGLEDVPGDVLLFSLLTPVPTEGDQDGDGIPDASDACCQTYDCGYDSNANGIPNFCDGDFDSSSAITQTDASRFIQCFTTVPAGESPRLYTDSSGLSCGHMDMDGSDTLNVTDFGIFTGYYQGQASVPPGEVCQ